METTELLALKEMILLTDQYIDIQFQFWLSISFATVVASYTGKEHFTPKIKTIVIALYIIATFTFLSRWGYAGADNIIYRSMLISINADPGTPIYTLIFRMLLMISGSVATIYFVYTSNRKV